jgi:hypothetical protein
MIYEFKTVSRPDAAQLPSHTSGHQRKLNQQLADRGFPANPASPDRHEVQYRHRPTRHYAVPYFVHCEYLRGCAGSLELPGREWLVAGETSTPSSASAYDRPQAQREPGHDANGKVKCFLRRVGRRRRCQLDQCGRPLQCRGSIGDLGNSTDSNLWDAKSAHRGDGTLPLRLSSSFLQPLGPVATEGSGATLHRRLAHWV